MLPEKFSWVKLDDKDFSSALEACLDNSEKRVLIMGPGGAGKSVIYQIAYELGPESKLALAVSGAAAANLALSGIPATTVHSGLRLAPKEWFVWDKKDKGSKRTLVNLTAADMVLIDEISMMNANLLDYILHQISVADKRRKRKGKEGIKLVLFGDIMQLPPVVSTDLERARFEEEYEGNHMFYNSNLFKEQEFRRFELYNVYRQSEAEFSSSLCSIRLGKAGPAELDYLNTRVVQDRGKEFFATHPDAIFITATNRRAEEINKIKEQRYKDNESRYYVARFTGKDAEQRFDKSVPRKVSIFVGQQVMCLANNNEYGYNNGTIGTVIGFSRDLPIIRTKDGRELVVHRAEWTAYKAYIEDGVLRHDKVASMRQIACKPAFAMTFHKVQGLTLDSVFIDLSGWREVGSAYLGLSRVRSIKGLALSRPLNLWDVRANPLSLKYFDEDTFKRKGELF